MSSTWVVGSPAFIGTLSVANGGTGSTSFNPNCVVLGNSTSSTGQLEFVTSTGTIGQVLTSNGVGAFPSWQNAAGGSGTVTSVAAAGPSGLFTWSAAVTSSGTLTASLSTQTANKSFLGPTSGSAAAPTFRYIATADLVQAASHNDGSILFQGSGGYLTQDAAGCFAYDVSGTGPLATPATLYIGGSNSGVNLGLLALFDSNSGAFASINSYGGFFLNSPGSAATAGDASLTCAETFTVLQPAAFGQKTAQTGSVSSLCAVASGSVVSNTQYRIDAVVKIRSGTGTVTVEVAFTDPQSVAQTLSLYSVSGGTLASAL